MAPRFIKPEEGRRVPLPDGSVLPERGRWIDNDGFVLRRLRDGDVVEAKLPPPEAKPADAAPADAAHATPPAAVEHEE